MDLYDNLAFKEIIQNAKTEKALLRDKIDIIVTEDSGL
jgi:hypothetical protein